MLTKHAHTQRVKMFDSSGRLVIPVAVVGGGAYGTVYKARRYNKDVSRLVASYLGGCPTSSFPPSGKGGAHQPPTTATNADDCVARSALAGSDEARRSSVQDGSLLVNPSATLSPPSRAAAAAAAASVVSVDSAGETQPPALCRGEAGVAGAVSSSSPAKSSPIPAFEFVAVKEVSFELIPDDIADVLKEVCFMRSMRHPHVIAYFSSFVHGGTYGGGVPRAAAVAARRRKAETAAAAAAVDARATADDDEAAAADLVSAAAVSQDTLPMPTVRGNVGGGHASPRTAAPLRSGRAVPAATAGATEAALEYIEVDLSDATLRPPREMEGLARRAMQALGLSSSEATEAAPSARRHRNSSDGEDGECAYSGGLTSLAGGNGTCEVQRQHAAARLSSVGIGGVEAFSPLPSMCVVEELATGLSLSELVRLRCANAPPAAPAARNGGTTDATNNNNSSNTNANGCGEQSGIDLGLAPAAAARRGSGPLAPAELASLLDHILRALDYLHAEARIVHRDVKCANVAVDGASGLAKLLDFGTCGAIDNPSVTRHTVLGTPGWIAPEVLAGGVVATSEGLAARLGYGFRSDVWSLGVTALELAFLRPATAAQSDPFFAKAIKYLSQIQCSASAEMRAAVEASNVGGGADASSSSSQQQQRPRELTHFIIPPPSSASPFALAQPDAAHFTPALQDLVACCLRRDPSLRPSAAELLRHPYFTETLGAGEMEIFTKKAAGAAPPTSSLIAQQEDGGGVASGQSEVETEAESGAFSKEMNDRRVRERCCPRAIDTCAVLRDMVRYTKRAARRAAKQQQQRAGDASSAAAANGNGGGEGGCEPDSGDALRPMRTRPILAHGAAALEANSQPRGGPASASPQPQQQKSQQQSHHPAELPTPSLGLQGGLGGQGSAIRLPYPMQFLGLFTATYSETAALQQLNERSAAASMAVLKNVLAPAARSAPALAMEIQKKFRTAVALQSGVPLASFVPTSAASVPASAAVPSSTTAGASSTASASAAAAAAANPMAPTGVEGVLPPAVQQQLQQLALGYHADDPERYRRAALLMEEHVEILFALEKRLPGFAEKFTAKFIETLLTDHPEGGDVVANAVQMIARMRSDVLKPDVLPRDPNATTLEATTDRWKEQRPPVLPKMRSSPAIVGGQQRRSGRATVSPAGDATSVAAAEAARAKAKAAAAAGNGATERPPEEAHIDPTAFLFNQVVDHYSASGAAGGVGPAGGPASQHNAVSRWAGL